MLPALRLVSHGDPAGGPSEKGHPARTGNGAERKPTILVVEDEILIRLATSDYLREKGYRVLEASNANEALAVFAAGEPIELVFSDIDMPGTMNGGALAEWIRKQFPDVRILLTSGEDIGRRDTSVSKEYGAILRKPYSYETLLSQVRRLLSA